MKSKISIDQDPQWIKTYGGKRFVKFIHGINNSYDNGEATIGGVAIDAGAADLIFLLNQKKYFTEFHCSGLKEDHFYKSQKKYEFLGGYICFKNPKRAAKLIKYLPKPLEWRDWGFYFVQNSGWNLPDEVKKNAWDELRDNLLNVGV